MPSKKIRGNSGDRVGPNPPYLGLNDAWDTPGHLAETRSRRANLPLAASRSTTPGQRLTPTAMNVAPEADGPDVDVTTGMSISYGGFADDDDENTVQREAPAPDLSAASSSLPSLSWHSHVRVHSARLEQSQAVVPTSQPRAPALAVPTSTPSTEARGSTSVVAASQTGQRDIMPTERATSSVSTRDHLCMNINLVTDLLTFEYQQSEGNANLLRTSMAIRMPTRVNLNAANLQSGSRSQTPRLRSGPTKNSGKAPGQKGWRRRYELEDLKPAIRPMFQKFGNVSINAKLLTARLLSFTNPAPELAQAVVDGVEDDSGTDIQLREKEPPYEIVSAEWLRG